MNDIGIKYDKKGRVLFCTFLILCILLLFLILNGNNFDLNIKSSYNVVHNNSNFATGTQATFCTLFVFGDVTGDGKVTVSDVAKLYQFIKSKINNLE